MKILIASNNVGKIVEFRMLLDDINGLKLLSPSDIGISDFIPLENGETFKDNAYIKARAFYKKTKLACIADDSGLIVEELDDEPGVKSSRYAGPNANDIDNINHLLKNLEGVKNRKARFETVLCYYDGIGLEYSRGKIKGTIALESRGNEGFGYDSVFIPEGYDKTFAEMSREEKSKLSHRRKAIEILKQNLIKQL